MSSEPTCAASPCTYPPYCLTPALAPQHVPHPHVDGGTGYRTMTADHRPSIPPPPPPPPPKIKSRSYFERFVAQPLQSAAYASRPPSVQAHRANADVAPLNPLVPKLLGYVYFHSPPPCAFAPCSVRNRCRCFRPVTRWRVWLLPVGPFPIEPLASFVVSCTVCPPCTCHIPSGDMIDLRSLLRTP